MSLEYLKKHVRADDFTEDDEYLESLLEEAEAAVVGMTNRSMAELTELGDGEFPKPLRRAVLLLAGHWYNQRESVSTAGMQEVPDTLQALVRPWRKLGRDESGES